MRLLLLLSACTALYATDAWRPGYHHAKAQSTQFPSRAYPTSNQWHLGLNLAQGLSHITIDEAYTWLDFPQLKTSTLAYRAGAELFFGYGKIVALQARGFYNQGFIDYGYDISGPYYSLENRLINSEASLLTAIVLSRALRLTLQPSVGFDYHNYKFGFRTSKRPEAKKANYRLQFWGPLAGLGFGINPCKRLSLQSRLAFHFPRGQHDYYSKQRQKLNIRRHGLSLILSSTYALTKNCQWTMSFEHIQLSAYGYGNPSTSSTSSYDQSRLGQTSLTSGICLSF
jgi:hypothetical protein